MAWLRIYPEIMWDRKLRRHPAHVRWCWIGLLCMAKESPVQGSLLISCDVPVTFQDVTDVTALTLEEVREAISIFEEQSMLTKDESSGAWVVANWDKRQFRSDSSVERTRRYRDGQRSASQKRKCNVTEPSQETSQERPPERHSDAPDYRLQITETEVSKPAPSGDAEDPRPGNGPDENAALPHEESEDESPPVRREEVPNAYRETYDHFLLKTGRTSISPEELGFLKILEKKHTPARVQKEITTALTRFVSTKRPPFELTWEYLYDALKRQNSLGPRKKSQGKRASPVPAVAEENDGFVRRGEVRCEADG